MAVCSEREGSCRRDTFRVGVDLFMLVTARLKSLRKEYYFKQSDVADKIGIGRTTYSKYETGDILPPVDQVVKLSNLFNVSTDYLLNKSDDLG